MMLHFDWFLPTNGDGRSVVGGGHGVATGSAGTIRPASLGYPAQIARSAEVAERIEEYAALGISEFILSGYPHLEEAYWFGEGVLPILRERGRWQHPAPDGGETVITATPFAPTPGPAQPAAASQTLLPAERPVVSARRQPQPNPEVDVMRIAVVTGNPKPSSRTHGAALAVAGALAAALVGPGAPGAHLVVDLAEFAASLFDSADAELSRLTAQVAAADIAVFASPTYKASYTGMLKAFLDRYGNNGLAGTVAVPVMTGGWAGHSLAVEVHLRPVLVELGATVPARGLYVTEPQFADLDAVVARWAAAAVPLIRGALAGYKASEA